MVKKIYILILLGLFTAAQNQLSAQQVDSILSLTETKYLQEKIYLQTDKNVYAAGETVWFKAYLAADNQPIPLSKTMYAELLNEKGAILQTKTMPVLFSGAASDFILPDSIPDSRLFIRAYTSWMLNFDSSLLTIKSIPLIQKKTAGKKTAPVYSINFFPEGGDLVEKILSHVAFKATDQDGVPAEVKGDIISGSNKTVCSFTSVHDGMGYFVMIPEPGETYKAVWKDKSGAKHETTLPAAKKEGVVLSIGRPNGQLNYSLTRSDSASPEFLRYTVVAQIQQRMMYTAQINLTKKSTVTAPMLTDSMPDGIMQITVFNDLMEPVAERLVFINNNTYSFITDLHIVEQNIVKHGRNVIQLDVGGTLLSNLSVSVTDGDVNPVSKNESSIYSGLLLTPDLKGSVYNPVYYFSSEDDSVKQHLDLVMMTNGWRRFKWEKLLTNQWPQLKYKPDDFLTIEGKVLGLSRTMLFGRQITGILKTKSDQPAFINFPITEKGDFSVGSQFFFDTAKLYYQLSNDKDKSITSSASFSFKNTFTKGPQLNKDFLSILNAPNTMDSSAMNKSANLAALRRKQELSAPKIKTLDEVQIKTKQKSPKEKMEELYVSGLFTGGNSQTFLVEDDPFGKNSMGVLEYLQGKVAGLQINTSGNGSATWRGSNTSFFLNEMNSDVGMIRTVNMPDVAMIKVFQPPFIGAVGGGAGGAIAVYTKKGSSANSDFKGLPFININGYSPIREFYSPDYSNNADPTANDYRTTLFWSPNILIDKNSRRITLPFFNSDNCKKLRVIVEGINEAGLLSREEKLFQ